MLNSLWFELFRGNTRHVLMGLSHFRRLLVEPLFVTFQILCEVSSAGPGTLQVLSIFYLFLLIIQNSVL